MEESAAMEAEHAAAQRAAAAHAAGESSENAALHLPCWQDLPVSLDEPQPSGGLRGLTAGDQTGIIPLPTAAAIGSTQETAGLNTRHVHDLEAAGDGIPVKAC